DRAAAGQAGRSAGATTARPRAVRERLARTIDRQVVPHHGVLRRPGHAGLRECADQGPGLCRLLAVGSDREELDLSLSAAEAPGMPAGPGVRRFIAPHRPRL